MKKHKNILLIYTGGTIGMVRDEISGSLKPFDFENISDQVPELSRFNAKLSTLAFDPLQDSSNMQPEVWLKIAKSIASSYHEYDGFVILHGSDTMAYTASALSFLLENLSKPVILTGSQLPIGEIRTDAKENLITAIEIASDDSHQLAEVCILFDFQLYRGNRAVKYSSEKFQAFRSVNYPALAEAGVHLRYNQERFLPKPEGVFRAHVALDPHIALLKIYPGITTEAVSAVLSIKQLKGIVLETFGAGNGSTNPEFLQLLRTAITNGLIVFDVSQCLGGRVELGKYETSLHLKEMGVVSGADITTEAALAKMMFLFAHYSDGSEIKRKLAESMRGELTP